MHPALKRIAIALLATSAAVGLATAQESYPCVNDAPNPYKQVTGWEHLPRHWAPTNNVYVDGKDNVWVMDRCGPGGCLSSKDAPIWELSSDGKPMKNFGDGMFVFPTRSSPTQTATSGRSTATPRKARAIRSSSSRRTGKC